MTDSELLVRFTREKDQAAFAELLHRHLDVIYAAALRHSRGNAHEAEEIAQQVFTALAGKADRLVKHPCVLAWLYTTTRLVARERYRGQVRREQREQAAQLMSESNQEPDWNRLQPVIDEALTDLNERERRGILLRFFARQDFRAIGTQLELTENAAQKLVTRALDRLNVALVRRGITSTSAALGVALVHETVAAPATLAASIQGVIAAGVVPAAGVSSVAILLAKIGLGAGAAAAVFVGGVAYGSRKLPPAPAPAPIQVRVPVESPELRQKLAEANRRAEQAEEDNARLLTAVERYKSATNRSVVVPVAVAPSPPPLIGPGEYGITGGDTLAKIATRQGLTLEQLRALNPDVNWARLRIGQVIRVQ